MGRRWRKKNKKQASSSTAAKKSSRSSYNKREQEDGDNFVTKIVEQGNFKMEAYYAAQGLHNSYYNNVGQLVPCTTNEEKEAERRRWRHMIGVILPTSFRIAKDVPERLRERMEAELQQLNNNDSNNDNNNNDQKTVIRKLSFLPHAYQLGLDKTTIRKEPQLRPLHEWLKRHTSSGFITRQETVSMIPPVVLKPKPSDLVLDMCAAPGSKTSQLLQDVDYESGGCVIANDATGHRAYMLVHQLRRIMHTNPVVLITNCQAQWFPSTIVQFDCILCDVPCSGDGTSRKNIAVWQKWSQRASLGLHSLQVQIAWKGVELLKVGACLCYSTCSFNPTENEAVVAELLRRSEGKLELVEIQLEGFRTRPGMSSWKVFCEDKSRKEMKDWKKKNNAKMQQRRREWQEKEKEAKGGGQATKESTTEKDDGNDKPDAVEEQASAESVAIAASSATSDRGDNENDESGQDKDDGEQQQEDDMARTYRKFEPTSMDEASLIEMAVSSGMQYFPTFENVPENYQRRVRKSCFAPTEEEAKQFHLERCVRCLPQDNDTGGFFIALLRKVAPISRKDRRKQAAESEGVGDGPDVKRAKMVSGTTVVAKEDDEKVLEEETDDIDFTDVGLDAEEDDMDLEGIDDDNKPIRGQVKGNYIRDKDGKAHPELGRDDFVPVKDAILAPLIEYYGLSSPTFRKDLYMTRAGGDVKIIYYIAKPVKDLIDLGIQKRVTVINSGLKGFVRGKQEGSVSYRLAQEGVHFLAPHMNKRKFVVKRDDFVKCLEACGGTMHFSCLSEEFQEVLRPISVGSFVVILEGHEERYEEKMILTMWRCRGESINGLVAKAEVEAIRSKLQAIGEVVNNS